MLPKALNCLSLLILAIVDAPKFLISMNFESISAYSLPQSTSVSFFLEYACVDILYKYCKAETYSLFLSNTVLTFYNLRNS